MSDNTRREFVGGAAAGALASAVPLAFAGPLGEPASYKMAVVGLVHAHVWGHLADMQKSKDVTLVGVAEPNPALRDEAKKAGVPDALLATDYRGMTEQTKPDLVWSFVENNRHLEIVEYL